MIDPEIGFTSDVITDTNRFVGRTQEVRSAIRALNNPLGLLAVYGKRGVGKSSILRQIQQLAVNDYSLAKKAGVWHEVPERIRTYLTVYYSCDSMIKNGSDLLSRLCNDQHPEDSLLRLIPNEGRETVEFTRSKEVHGGADLKVVNWGAKGVESSKYARVVPTDVVQTFRNFVNAVVTHQVKGRMKRDGLLILLDEFDVIQDKTGLGSLIKSLTSKEIKFGICGIARDLHELVADHASVERLLEEGAIPVQKMGWPEMELIFTTATELFENRLRFEPAVVQRIITHSDGYPYLAQLFGKECVLRANQRGYTVITSELLKGLEEDIRAGKAFPTLERAYQTAIGNSKEREIMLHFLAAQEQTPDMYNDDVGRVLVKQLRADVEDHIKYIDQLMPRLVDPKYGPVLFRVPEKQGIYEFANPVLRLYVKLRNY